MKLTISKQEINSKLIELKGIHFVYYILDGDNCIYVGNSKNIGKRLKDHKFDKDFSSVKLVAFDSEVRAKTFERIEIFRLKPELNISCKDGFMIPEMKHQSVSIEDKIKACSILNR